MPEILLYYQVGDGLARPPDSMQGGEREREKGEGDFQVKRAVPLIAKRLGVSRYTVYNYLNEVRAGEEQASSDLGED